MRGENVPIRQLPFLFAIHVLKRLLAFKHKDTCFVYSYQVKKKRCTMRISIFHLLKVFSSV